MAKFYILEDDPNRMAILKPALIGADIVHEDTAAKFIEQLELDALNADPIDVIMLDHDLGGRQFVSSSEENTGMGVVRWMVQNPVDVKLIIVHTLNPPAGDEMVWRLEDAGYTNVLRVPFINLNFKGDLKGALLTAAGVIEEDES